MLPAELEKPLALMELQCQAVAAAVNSGDPVELEAASQALRNTAVDFSAFMDGLNGGMYSSPQVRARLKKLATNLGIQREGLLRRSAVIERGLNALVPSTQKSTYGRASAYRGFVS